LYGDQLNGASGIAFDSDDNVYVADKNNHRIIKFDKDGTVVSKWGKYEDNAIDFDSPAGIAIDSQDDVYVADTNNHRIIKFTNMTR
jgi:sugar lactone lactonase YvrE